MFRWKLMLQNLFGARSEQPKSRRPKKPVQLSLERLEDRTVPSATNPLGEASVASPPPASSVAAAISYLDSRLSQEEQRLATQQQDLLNAVQVVNQEIAQVVSYAKMELGHFFGINLIASNQANNSAASVTQTNSGTTKGSGAGSGAATTHHESDRPIHSFAQTAGSGKGSGVSPASSGGGSATVSGYIWLDNNGNGIFDKPAEMGFSRIKVTLLTSPGGTQVGSATTDGSGNYRITVENIPPSNKNQYVISVGIPQLDQATKQVKGGDSQINANGVSNPFGLPAGAAVTINGGIRSMNVTTIEDDGNALPPQNQITLRDAIQTGINGGGNMVTFFTTNAEGQQVPLTGTIKLQTALPVLSANVTIAGGGNAAPITVQGDGTDRIFTTNANVEIDGLTIVKGSAGTGGGIYSQGKLTLKGDAIAGNQANGFGGGLYIQAGTVSVFGGSFSNNTAGTGNGGGIYVNAGMLTLKDNVRISSNVVTPGQGIQGNGAGMYINAGKVSMSGGRVDNNTAGVRGGGIYNAAGTLTLTGGVNIGGMNSAVNQGSGMYLKIGSTTTFNTCNVVGNRPAAGGGTGVYWQSINMNNEATVIFGPGGLFDPDDPAIPGGPFKGP